jgi:hypothetical protein
VPHTQRAVTGSLVPEGVKSIYELVFNGLTFNIVKQATAEAIRAVTTVSGVGKISAANFGGKLDHTISISKKPLRNRSSSLLKRVQLAEMVIQECRRNALALFRISRISQI